MESLTDMPLMENHPGQMELPGDFAPVISWLNSDASDEWRQENFARTYSHQHHGAAFFEEKKIHDGENAHDVWDAPYVSGVHYPGQCVSHGSGHLVRAYNIRGMERTLWVPGTPP